MLNSIAEINQDLGTYDIVLENWEEIGLEKPSVVRLKFSEITNEDLISKVATLDKKDINRISQSIIKYFSA
jgi:mRNA interferase MazF